MATLARFHLREVAAIFVAVAVIVAGSWWLLQNSTPSTVDGFHLGQEASCERGPLLDYALAKMPRSLSETTASVVRCFASEVPVSAASRVIVVAHYPDGSWDAVAAGCRGLGPPNPPVCPGGGGPYIGGPIEGK